MGESFRILSCLDLRREGKRGHLNQIFLLGERDKVVAPPMKMELGEVVCFRMNVTSMLSTLAIPRCPESAHYNYKNICGMW